MSLVDDKDRQKAREKNLHTAKRDVMSRRYPNPTTAGCNANPCKSPGSKLWTWHWAGYRFHQECQPTEEELEKEAK